MCCNQVHNAARTRVCALYHITQKHQWKEENTLKHWGVTPTVSLTPPQHKHVRMFFILFADIFSFTSELLQVFSHQHPDNDQGKLFLLFYSQQVRMEASPEGTFPSFSWRKGIPRHHCCSYPSSGHPQLGSSYETGPQTALFSENPPFFIHSWGFEVSFRLQVTQSDIFMLLNRDY